jgi:hypothetical protein
MSKRFIVGIVAATSLAGLGSTGAFADNSGNGSDCGTAHAARADVYGNYGWLGSEGGTPGAHNGATGQDPGATGSNNSSTGCQGQ